MRAEVRATLLLALCGCGGALRQAPPSAPLGTAAQVWITTPDRAHLLERQGDVPFTSDAPAAATRITVDTSQRYQTMVGFGAAITDAAAELIQQRLQPAARDSLLRELFGRTGNGVGFSFARLTIGASDFSRNFFTYDDAPAGTRDTALSHFSIDSARPSVLPVVQRALTINPQLFLMATPWSAPAWMKSSRSLITGTLETSAYPAYAAYLQRYVASFARERVPIAAISVQNEPHNEPKDYPGMRFTAPQRAAFIGRHLGPLFAERRVKTQILDWDHNWDEPGSPLGVLADTVARRYVSGVAWHCYAGDVSAQSRVHDAHPDKDAFFTECAGGEWAPNFGDNLRWNMKTLVIGATRNWARGVALWNLALDEQHGPHTGGCNDCRGVLTINTQTGAITRNEEFYVLAHASRFVRPGAVRIASSTGADDIETVAFRNVDDGSIAMIVVNSATQPRTISVSVAGPAFTVTIPSGAVATLTWH